MRKGYVIFRTEQVTIPIPATWIALGNVLLEPEDFPTKRPIEMDDVFWTPELKLVVVLDHA